MDWCVQPFGRANHKPSAVLNGRKGAGLVRIRANPSASLELSARGSKDPDGNAVGYAWTVYSEAGTYRGPVTIEGSDRESARIQIPADSAGGTIHVILTVRDNGEPPLAAYRRAVIEIGRAL